MRFYEFNYVHVDHELDTDPTPRREWFASERDAVVRRMALFNTGMLLGKKNDHTIVAVDIDTSKSGLLAYLQTECV